MITVFKSHIAHRNPPLNLATDDRRLFAHEFEKEIQGSHVSKVEGAYLLRDIILKGLAPLSLLSYSHPRGLPVLSLLKRLALFTKTSQSIERGVWIIDDWSPGYFHWLTDALPRLMLANRIDEKLPVLLPSYYQDIEFVSASLELLKREFIFYPAKQPVKIKKLLLTSRTSTSGNYNQELIDELRTHFLRDFGKSGQRKIYISRAKAQKRKVINEREVADMVSRYGFEIHHFEDYPFQHQVKLMSEAKELIGLHGSGLTNMLFMPREGKVLELRNDGDRHNNCFFSLASDLGHDYYYLLNHGTVQDTFATDLRVDLIALEKVLKQMQGTT